MIDRRRLLLGAGLAGAGAVTTWLGSRAMAGPDPRFHGDDILGQARANGAWYRYRFVGQPVMDAQILFYLGLAPNGLTDIGEVLDAATRIVPGDERSWFETWREVAARLEAYGDEAWARGHVDSAARCWLRAGSYLRAGLIRYARREDPRIVADTRRALALHDRALAGLGYDSHELAIPYEGSVLHGRVHYAPGVDRAPVLVMHQGLHAWPEDTMWVVDGALRRGVHVLTFHGPGQGASLRLHGHPFRPDWEVVVGAVIDVAARDPRIDAGRVALMGLSFGGYLAPRAAAYDHRVWALIADPGVVDWGASMLRHFESLPGLLSLHASGPAAFDRAIDAVAQVMPDARWYFDDVTWKHGVDTPHEVIDELRRYRNDAVASIRCPTLILEGVAEDATPGESLRLFEALTCEKDLVIFDEASAAQTHCQGGGTQLAAMRLFDWFDERLARG